MSHIRSEDIRFQDAIDEIIEIGRVTKMPVQISPLFKNAPDYNPRVTLYQLNHLAGTLGNTTKYDEKRRRLACDCLHHAQSSRIRRVLTDV